MGRRFTSLFCALGLMGCYQGLDASTGSGGGQATDGAVDSGSDAGSSGDDGEPDEPPPSVDDGVALARVWRLSHAQYNNTIRDLLGTNLTPADSFEPEASGSGFLAGADVSYVSPLLFEQYLQASEDLSDAADLATLLPCDPPDPADEACVEAFIADFGQRTFRKPVPAALKETYRDLYRSDAPDAGVRMVMQAMLQSPHFLYRFELGEDGPAGDVVRLTPYELAAELSYLLWDTMPDAALLAAAANGELDTRAQVAAAADRLLEDPRSRHAMWSFAQQLFRLRNLPALGKDDSVEAFTPQVAAALAGEAEAFVQHVLDEGDGTLAELFTADYSMLNADLAEIYGVEVQGPEFVKTDLDPTQRAGIITHAGFLAMHSDDLSSHPVRRGHFIRGQLLCLDVPPPPPDVADDIEPPDGVKTTRQRFEAHVYDPSCAGCHISIDPLGFALEHYDVIGRYRDTENGEPIDASGEFFATADLDGKFNGAIEMAELLAGSRQVADCVSTQFFRYAFGRREDEMTDGPAITEIQTRFSDTDTELMELLRASVESDVFHYRVKL